MTSRSMSYSSPDTRSSVRRLPSSRGSSPRPPQPVGHRRGPFDELDLQRLGLLGETGHGARPQEPPRVEHDDGVADALDVSHEVRRDHDADPELAADAPDEVEHLAAAEWVEAGGRLVEKRDHRIVDERLRELHALLPSRSSTFPSAGTAPRTGPRGAAHPTPSSLAAVGGGPLIWAM